MSWVDANSARVREQLVSIDAFEISERHRRWGRILTRGAAAAGAGWALLNTYVLMPDAVTSVFGGVVIIVVTLMLAGIWMATSPGFTPR